MPIINEDLWIKRAKQKSFLVYLVSDCEMGSEGWSGWMYYAICHGDTEEDLYADWIEQCKNIYGVDLSKDIKHHTGLNEDGTEYDYWTCYYQLAKNELPDNVYGRSEPLVIEKCFAKHVFNNQYI